MERIGGFAEGLDKRKITKINMRKSTPRDKLISALFYRITVLFLAIDV
ncbi:MULTISPECIES: hypothetical protein [Niastella]|uniref:Uncharacterized protein n=1 Tax=Niastella soli TaxID=2821487 RepID=A0ABS3YVZ8_9BACT|nr:hypothetical protein [Niastella soli]MBO9201341.1 hypothetical protein [Niastella soli]